MPANRTLLVVSNMYPSARSERFGSFVADAVRSLEAAGWTVVLAVIGDPRTGSVRMARKYLALGYRTFAATLRGGYDAVHAHYLFPTGVYGWVAARLRGVPLVLYSHGTDVLMASRGWPVGPVTRALVRSADAIAVPSADHQALVASTFSLPASDIRIAPVGVDTERFGPGDRRAARTSLDLPDDATILGFFGALDDNKGAGCEDIIRALALEGGAGALGAATPNALDEALLVIVGEGSRLIRLESLATELGVTERVRFSQYVGRDELAAYYLAVDVVVVPSKRESLGLVALEARASGTPVVATRVGGLPEHVEPGVTGELYEPGDVPGLVAALKRVLNPATHTRYSPSLAADRWGLVATGRLLTTITDDVIDKRARRDG